MRKQAARIAAAGFVGVALGGFVTPASAAPPEGAATRYIVRTTSVAVTEAVSREVRRTGGDVDGTYGAVLPGLSATLTAAEAAEVLGVSVVTVERDWSAAKAWLAKEVRGEE